MTCDNTFNQNMPFEYDYLKAHRILAPFSSRLIEKTLVEADRRMEHQERFIKRMENARTSSIQRFSDLPKSATIRKEYVKCGKNDCEMSLGMKIHTYATLKISIKQVSGCI